MASPNTRVQRTRSSPSAHRSPLTRHPLGRSWTMRAAVASLVVTLMPLTCVGEDGPRESGRVHSGRYELRWSRWAASAYDYESGKRTSIYLNSYETCGTWYECRECPDGWYARSTHHILSAVGSIVSYQIAYDGSGGMHNTAGRSYKTLDLDDGEVADIAQLFQERDVLEALLSDEDIKKGLGDSRPTTLEELVDALGEPCEVDYRSLRSSFRVKAVGVHTAEVEFGLGHGCEVDRGAFTSIDVEVAIPNELQGLFQEAARNLPLFPSKDPDLDEP